MIFGRPAPEAAAEEAARIGASRVFIVASKSLSRGTPVVRTIAHALGARSVILDPGVTVHTPEWLWLSTGDLASRLACQQPSWLAASTIARVNYGASHGIGHALGAAADVPHGYTSCAMLPHVKRYNEAATREKQRMIAEASMKNLWVRSNPQPIRAPHDVMRLLEAAW